MWAEGGRDAAAALAGLVPDEDESAFEPEWSLDSMTSDDLEGGRLTSRLVSPFVTLETADVGGGFEAAEGRVFEAVESMRYADFEQSADLDRAAAADEAFGAGSGDSWPATEAPLFEAEKSETYDEAETEGVETAEGFEWELHEEYAGEFQEEMEEKLAVGEREGLLTHASGEALGRLAPPAAEALDPDDEGSAGQSWTARLLEQSVLVTSIAAGQRSESVLTDRIFRLRHPAYRDKPIAKGDESAMAEWRQIRDRQVVPLLLTGPFIGPMHDSPATTPVNTDLRKGVPGAAVLSPLSITRRGLRQAPTRQPGTIAAIVVHNTSRGPANKSRKDGYRRPAIEYALDHYLNGTEGFPHYVVDFNGTIYATCDERFVAWHAGWVHAGGAKLFRSGWTAPDWWSRVWSRHGAATPIDLLLKGATSPNSRTIGIELLLLPDMSYTPRQYRALARLIVDIQRRNPDVQISQAPSRALLGHEDFAPVTANGGRADSHGGWDPGAHRDRPFFDWQRLWTEIRTLGDQSSAQTPKSLEAEAEGPVPPVYRDSAYAGESESTTPTLRQGSRGPAVRRLQESLRTAGHSVGVDGDFGARTGAALRAFQSQTGLVADGVVGPATWNALMRHTAAPPPALPPSGAETRSNAALGKLVLRVPGRRDFTYQFTPQDLEWTAKLIVGEAGGRDNLENAAVLTAMLNRYTLRGHRKYPSFAAFIRSYSTTLQPELHSAGAAARHAHKPPDQYVRTGGTYPGTTIPRGQLRKYLDLQKAPWSSIKPSARALATRALSGRLVNPGVGLASQFASTRVYFYQHYKRYPTPEEWRRYTMDLAAKQKWRWIGDVPGLDQMENAFFIDLRDADLAIDAVRVLAADDSGEIQGEAPWD